MRKTEMQKIDVIYCNHCKKKIEIPGWYTAHLEKNAPISEFCNKQCADQFTEKKKPVKRTFKCTGCGDDRPCTLEITQELRNGILDDPTEDLACVLDSTNQTSYNWKVL